MRGFLLGLAISVAFMIGCIASHLIIPPARAGTSPVRWEYLCDTAGFGSSIEGFAQTATKAGHEGWELIGLFGGNASAYCFKRPLP